ncbi:hypothetical protein GEMRC1_009020 [Eukaryota sp. GEM-RC1]
MLFSFSENQWKPSPSYQDIHGLDIPYKPFLRTERLGKAVDLSTTSHYPKAVREAKQTTGFVSVETKPLIKKSTRKPLQAQRKPFQPPFQEKPRYDKRRQRVQRVDRSITKVLRTLSVDPDITWEMVNEYPMSNLAKAVLPGKAELTGSVYKDCGTLLQYDRSLDSVTPKTRKVITLPHTPTPNPTASKDPVFADLAAEGKANVFASSDVLTAMMTCHRTALAFDFVVIKRDGFSVSENSESAPFAETGPDSPPSLFVEAKIAGDRAIQEFFSSTPSSAPQLEECPAELASDAHSYGHRYKLYDLPSGYKLAVRLPLMGYLQTSDGSLDQLYVRSLYEWHDQTTMQSWRVQLEKAKKASSLAAEMHNNHTQMARWALEGHLADVSRVEVAFVSRPLEAAGNPELLGTIYSSTRAFLDQLSISINNSWACLLVLLEEVKKLDDGVYVFVKPPTKTVLRLYSVPSASVVDDLEGTVVDLAQ